MDVEIAPRVKSILPDDEYVYLLGVALYAYDRMFSLVIEMLGYAQDDKSWYDLMVRIPNRTKTLAEHFGEDVSTSFEELSYRRNRIVHGFPVTNNGRQILATLHKDLRQEIIEKEYLQTFITDVTDLEHMLDVIRCNKDAKIG